MLRKVKDFFKRIVFQGKRLEAIDKIGGPFGFREGRFLFKIAKSLNNNSVIVEIGAFKGKSTAYIAEGIGSKQIQFFSIDTWYSDAMSQDREDVYHIFLENIKTYKDKVQPLRGYSYEIRKNWPQQKVIDFLWIDGDHSYEGVKKDIEDWGPLVKKNSFICFHDYRDAPGVKKAVDEIVLDGTVRFIKSVSGVYATKRN